MIEQAKCNENIELCRNLKMARDVFYMLDKTIRELVYKPKYNF